MMLRSLAAVAGLLHFLAAAHTLPISYLRLVPDADYLHLELVFNPFELSFMSELDENKDAELSPAELEAHGQMLANRVTAALKLTVGGREVRPETAGMDPDMTGHHVRLRAHYKVDARRSPLTVDSDLISITSASHLIQVTYAYPEGEQRAQLDSRSHKVTFTPPPATKAVPASPTDQKRAVFGSTLLLVAVFALLIVGAGLILFARKQMRS
jgi:hypothetical protein